MGDRRGGNGKRRISSFFVTSFPEKYKSRDLYKVFVKYGDIDEMVIPLKKDIRSNIYGFVRYFDVEGERLMAIKLDNIFMEERKIRANIPRFNRGGRADQGKPLEFDLREKLRGCHGKRGK
ncbi:uncharacterized protein LOC131650917 [Vicia villosa]|uniref:uncharacterized protein LOC131650917 n=1 Tax=Vicia villosa TaxID=3911 RepID=UPI00273B598D|nr:uncharacterized protein LOC131650917 [Vicia villosa]